MDYTINEPTILSDVDEAEESFASLLKKKWRLCHSTVINIRPESFGELSLSINRSLNNSRKKTEPYKVHLKTCPTLRLSDSASEGLKVEVRYNGYKVVYTAYLLNFSNNPEDFARLPLCLVDGNLKIIRRMRHVLANSLFCTIREVGMNDRDLLTIFGLLVKFSSDEEKGSSKLKFHLPGLPERNFINVSLRVVDLTVVLNFWNQQVIGTDDQIQDVFYTKVLTHIRKAYSIDLSLAKLAEVALPDALVNKNGQVQFHRLSPVNPILRVIQTLVIDAVMSTPAPSIPSGSS